MKKFFIYTFAGIALCSACKKDYTIENTRTEVPDRSKVAYVKFINASPSSPSVNFYFNNLKLTGVLSSTGIESGLAYGSSFPGQYVSVNAGTGKLTAKIPSGAATDANLEVYSGETKFEAGKNYSLFAVDSYDASAKTFNTFMVEDKLPAVDTSKAYLRLINVSPNIGTLQITDEAGAVILKDVTYKSGSDFIAITPIGTTKYIFKGTTVISSVVPFTFTKGRIYSMYLRGLTGTNGSPTVYTLTTYLMN